MAEFAGAVNKINDAVAQIGKQMAQAFAHLSRPDARLSAILARLRQDRALLEQIEALGWLPHYTTPVEKLAGENADPASDLPQFYSERWAEIEADFLAHLDRYSVDDEAKATFREGLAGHRHGLYRSTSRLLFPEIERLARKYLHEGAVSPAITSQHELREISWQLTPKALDDHGWYALSLLTVLKEHLYRYVTSAEDLEQVAANPIPNRHAVIHGHISYPSSQNSINMLIMTDFLFQVFSAFAVLSGEAE